MCIYIYIYIYIHIHILHIYIYIYIVCVCVCVLGHSRNCTGKMSVPLLVTWMGLRVGARRGSHGNIRRTGNTVVRSDNNVINGVVAMIRNRNKDMLHSCLPKQLKCGRCTMDQVGQALWVLGCVGACMHACVRAWVGACMHACVFTCVGGWVGG